ncbi:MAG: hypothetical protein RL434_2604, partial [Pseudomonadota bacterium]
MAEQINIEVITNSLRNFAKAWAEANRQAQLNKERRKKLENEAKRLRKPVEQAKPWPGAVPETERQEELAAFRGDKPGIAVAFVDIGLDGAPLDYRVYSGLQNASTTGTRVELLFMGPKQFIEGGPAGTPLYGWFTRQIAGTIDETFLLPINGEDCILVTWQRE